MDWDWLITVGILLSLVLFLWAKASGQTIPELIRNLVDIFRDTGEDVADNVTYGYYD